MTGNNTYKLNNKGFSLVELIVAVSLGVIIAGSVASLMIFSLRNYRDQSANTAMQYELQTNLNQIMDEIMSSKGMVVAQNTGTGEPRTKYAAFGDFSADIGGAKGFKGVIFVPGTLDSQNRFNVYMMRAEKAYDSSITTPILMAEDLYSTIQGAFSTTPNPYLLGQGAMKFDIIPDPEGTCLDSTNYKYVNPLSVKVELEFEKDATAKKVNKHVSDVTYMRNKVTDSIFIDGVEYQLKKKE